mgnify:CR=1 FL=1
MLKNIKKIFSHSVYRKTFYLYAISSVLITAIILLCVFGVVSSEIKKQAKETSYQLLQQFVSSSDRVSEDIGNMMSSIYSNGKTLKVIQNMKVDKVDEYRLFLNLQNLQSYYSYIENIAVLNLNQGVCVQTIGANEFTAETMKTVGTMIEKEQYILPRDIRVLGSEKSVISFLQYYPSQNCGILVDVNSNMFQYSVNEQAEIARVVYLIDAEGKPVTKVTRQKLNDEVLISDYLFQIVSGLKADDNNGVYDDRKNQQMVLVTKSDGLNCWFCDILSYSYFNEQYKKMSAIFVGITATILGISVLAVFLYSKKMKEKLLKIANYCRSIAGMEKLPTDNELAYIEKTMSRISHEKRMNENYINFWFLKNLILGQGMPFILSVEKICSLQKKYDSPYYAVLLINIQKKEEIPEDKRKEEYGIYRFTICNLADEIFGESYRCKAVDLDENVVAVLLFIHSSTISDDYLLCYNRLRDFTENNIGLFLSGSLGSVVDSQSEVFLSYEKAKQYMKVSNLIGKKELIDSNNISNVNYQEKNQKLVESILEYTELNFSDPDLSLKSISQMFHLSTAYVGKIFKTIQGNSYASYLVNYRLERSKTLLLETNKTVNEIAGELGFTNATYFTTLFKNEYGMTPTTFRNKG